MANPTLPNDILVNIASRLAKDRYWFLGPLIMAGKQGRDLVYYNDDILKGACIHYLCIDGSDISPGGRYMPFFVRCLQKDNPIALYQEGIRVSTQEGGDIDVGLMHLDKIILTDANAALAAAIFSICDGRREKAGMYLDILTNNHHIDLHGDEVEEMGEDILIDICGFSPSRTRKYQKTIKFPVCESYVIPPCIRKEHHFFTPGYSSNCNDCYVWWLANSVSWII